MAELLMFGLAGVAMMLELYRAGLMLLVPLLLWVGTVGLGYFFDCDWFSHLFIIVGLLVMAVVAAPYLTWFKHKK
jgi:hypothetical protein